MVGELAELVTGGQVGSWLIIGFLVLYFGYKEWPDFKDRITKGALKEQQEEETDRSVTQRLDIIEADVKEINDKLKRDYDRINKADEQIKKTKEAQSDQMDELEIIMRALLGVLRGLQEQGTNGPTKEAEAEIQNYLSKKAHHNDQE